MMGRASSVRVFILYTKTPPRCLQPAANHTVRGEIYALNLQNLW